MKRLLLLLSHLPIFISRLSGQQDTGMITGLVTDGSNAPVSGAAVFVINRNTNVRTGVTTGSDGIYVATPLKIGAYAVQVEVTGFKKVLREGIQLQVQDRLRLDFQLEVGDVTQTVEVRAESPLLQSESTSLGQVIDKRSVADLPLNGRNFTQLIVLAPGAHLLPYHHPAELAHRCSYRSRTKPQRARAADQYQESRAWYRRELARCIREGY